MNCIEEIKRFQRDRRLPERPYNWLNETTNIFEELLEANGYVVPSKVRDEFRSAISHFSKELRTIDGIDLAPTTQEDVVDAYADIIVFSIGAIMKLGYDPELVLNEVAKEINSRKGEIVNGKFQKFTDKVHTDQWYAADFRKAKLQ